MHNFSYVFIRTVDESSLSLLGSSFLPVDDVVVCMCERVHARASCRAAHSCLGHRGDGILDSFY